MKVTSEMRFPHPVLWSETGDYSKSGFSIALTTVENTSSQTVKLQCQVTLTESTVQSLIAKGEASTGISVVCLDTYYNRLHPLPPNGEVDFGSGQLRGTVFVRPIVWATKYITGFSSPSIHSEFGSGPFAFDSSTILALGDEVAIDVGTEKIAPIGSIFVLARDDRIPENQVATQTEEDKIQILACQKTLGWITAMRNASMGKPVVLNGIYMPVVMDVLNVMRRRDPVDEPKRWYRVFKAKLTALGLSLESDDLLKTAQALLRSPLGKLETMEFS